MEEKHVPYIVFEGELARMERIIKRLWILIIIMFLALVGSNLAWLYYENQFEDVVTTTTVTQESESDTGDAFNVNGDYINGTSEADRQDNN